MIKFKKISSLLVLASLLTGCSDFQTKYEKQVKVSRKQKVIMDELDATNSFLSNEKKKLELELEYEKAKSASYQGSGDLAQNYEKSLQAMIDDLTKSLGQTSSSNEVFTTKEGDVVIRMKERVLFSPGVSDLSSSGKKVLRKILTELKKYPGKTIRVDGHTDSDKIVRHAKSYSSNWDLSARRSTRVVEYLVSQGMSGKKIFLAGFGQFKPLDASNKRKNRRVEIVILNR